MKKEQRRGQNYSGLGSEQKEGVGEELGAWKREEERIWVRV